MYGPVFTHLKSLGFGLVRLNSQRNNSNLSSLSMVAGGVSFVLM